MLVGLGWRITGHCDTKDTRTMAITSRDAAGVKFIITAHKDSVEEHSLTASVFKHGYHLYTTVVIALALW